MSTRDHYPAGVPCWVESLQADPRSATEFYGSLFGWEFSGDDEYAVARLNGQDVAGIARLSGTDVPTAWITHVRVESADAAAEAAVRAGGRVVTQPFDVLPAGRLATVADPAGALLCVWEAAAREGAQLINEPGAWAMSALQTLEPEVSGFYSETFGWETESFGPVTMFRRPGYEGGEPEQPVPRDVVAVMVPAEPGQPAQWGVDFWVADADATAERAGALGGRVIVAPHDRPPGFRSAVLADPAGATFSISRPPGPAGG